MSNNLAIIDQFTNAFTTFIDSGFGLIRPEVGFLVTALIGIDVVLAGLTWVLNREDDVLLRFARKILFVGFFAYILNNFNGLAGIVFNSFAGLGLEAAGSPLTYNDFLQPGHIAMAGVTAGQPLVNQLAGLLTFTSFVGNLIQILVLVLAWIVTIISFFVLAILVFLAIIEFKLVTLLGFVLVPFALWRGTSFIAEPVLGSIVTAGIRIMTYAVVVGIGTTLFAQLVPNGNGQALTINDALAILLGALTIVGLAFAGPRIAAGLHSGAPQLGLGAVVPPAAIAVGGAVGMGAAAAGAASAGVAAVRAGASLSGGAHTAYVLGRAAAGGEGVTGVAGGLAGTARAGARAMAAGPADLGKRAAADLAERFASGSRAAWAATGGRPVGEAASPPAAAGSAANRSEAPGWARRMRGDEMARTASRMAREAEGGGGGLKPSLREE
jgi:type IV secretion system protein TrbL